MWKPVVGFEDAYEVSECGEVRRTGKARGATVGRVMKQHDSRAGYPMVRIVRSGEDYHAFVHRLVAAAFIGPCPIGKEVNHKDSDRTNPHFSNLEYVTRSENCRHAVANGRRDDGPKGEQKTGHKLTEADVRAIRASHEPQRVLGPVYGVHPGTISDVRTRRKWKHVV
jgi:hypothetical protein